MNYLKKGKVATAEQRRVYDYKETELLARPVIPPSACELLLSCKGSNNQKYLSKAEEFEKQRAIAKEKAFLDERKKLQEKFQAAVILLETSINQHNDLMAAAAMQQASAAVKDTKKKINRKLPLPLKIKSSVIYSILPIDMSIKKVTLFFIFSDSFLFLFIFDCC